MRETLLGWIGSLCIRRPRHVLAVALLLSVGSVALLPSLEISSSRFDLIGGDASFVDAAGARTELVAAITASDPRAGRAAADELARRLADELPEAHAVLHRIDPSFWRGRELLFLPPDELGAVVDGAAQGSSLVEFTESARRAMGGDDGSQDLDGLETQETNDAPLNEEAGLRFLTELLEEAERWQDDPERSQLAFTRGGPSPPVDAAGYFASRDARTRYVFVTPTEATDRYAYVEPLTRRARAIGAEVAEAHHVEIAFTGYPALAVDEIEAIRDGSIVTGLVAAALVMSLFALGFRSVGGVVIAGAPLGVGMLWAFGMIAGAIGHLNLLTQAAAPVFAGLGIDFAVHLLAAYDAERRIGIDHEEATDRMMRGAAKAVLTGGLTTAGAFLAMSVAEHEAFRELGLVAGFGLLIVLGSVLFLTPTLLTVGEERGWSWLQLGRGEAPASMVAGGSRLAALITRRPWLILTVVGLLTAGLALGIPRVRFDADVEALLPQAAESVVAAHDMRSQSTMSNEVLVARAPDLATLQEMSAAMVALESVGRVESVASFLPRDVEARLEVLRSAPTRAPGRASQTSLSSSLEGLASAAHATAEDLDRVAAGDLSDRLEALAAAAEALRDGLDPARVSDFDAALGEHLSGVREGIERARTGAVGALTFDDLPEGIRRRLADEGEGYPLYVYPADDVFADGALDTFLEETRGVAPGVAGSPVDFAAFLAGMTSSLTLAAMLAGLVVAVLLGADLRHPRDVLLALVPVALGVTWLFGLMGWLGIDTNMANLAALPLVLGIGVDDGVHLIHKRRREKNTATALRSVLRALVLTTCTTIAGFGAIGLASHRGMQSFALVMVIGAAGCLLATVVALPSLMQLVLPTEPSDDAHAE